MEHTKTRPSRHDPQKTLIVLQVTPFCNLDCDYCYLPHRSDKQKMSFETLREIFSQVLNSPNLETPLNFVWHAGEPLVVPVDYYRTAANILEELNASIGKEYILSLQTNATLISSEWIQFLRQYQMSIGVSIDGPSFIHDQHRLTRSGKGTHAATLKGVKQLQDADVPFSVIMVLTDQALDYPDEVFHFFLEHQIERVGFNIDEIEGVNTTSTYQTNDAERRYRQFMRRFLELCRLHPGKVQIREFHDTLRAMSFIQEGKDTDVVCSTNQPMRILNFTCEGNYTTFCPELLGIKSNKYQDFLMGNIHSEPIDTIFNHPVFRQINEEIQSGVEACKASCEYWDFCGGGSPANKFFERGSFDATETMHCRIHKKALVDTVVAYLEEQITVVPS